jgi:hypothetical protein
MHSPRSPNRRMPEIIHRWVLISFRQSRLLAISVCHSGCEAAQSRGHRGAIFGRIRTRTRRRHWRCVLSGRFACVSMNHAYSIHMRFRPQRLLILSWIRRSFVSRSLPNAGGGPDCRVHFTLKGGWPPSPGAGPPQNPILLPRVARPSSAWAGVLAGRSIWSHQQRSRPGGSPPFLGRELGAQHPRKPHPVVPHLLPSLLKIPDLGTSPQPDPVFLLLSPLTCDNIDIRKLS